MPDDRLQKRLHFLLRRAKQAQRDWGLIADGDRILVGASGGADSTVLLHILAAWQRIAPERFELAALHIQPEDDPTNEDRRDLLRDHLARLGIELEIAAGEFRTAAPDSRAGFDCFLCARNRRRGLFTYAHERGFNKVALGHHLDDAVETALMNLISQSSLDTMEPKLEFFEGALTLIRPLILAEKREIARVAAVLDFPFFACACPGAGNDTRRVAARDFLASFGREAKTIKRNIWSATRNWPLRPRY